ncbi:hypothetical protein OH492_10140 [Vibrio chagasii]|nr:hypothetical protein [Vibrio chagasii]
MPDLPLYLLTPSYYMQRCGVYGSNGVDGSVINREKGPVLNFSMTTAIDTIAKSVCT